MQIAALVIAGWAALTLLCLATLLSLAGRSGRRRRN